MKGLYSDLPKRIEERRPLFSGDVTNEEHMSFAFYDVSTGNARPT